MLASAFQYLTVLDLFFLGNSPPIKIDATKTPPVSGASDDIVFSGPVMVIVLIGLLILTAAIVLILRLYYTPNSPEAARPADGTGTQGASGAGAER